MIIRFIAFALTLLLMTPGSVLSVMADPVGGAASSVAANIGTTVASEAIRQKAAADVQGRCGG